MIWPFKKKSEPSNELFAVYNAIVAQSRQEKFFLNFDIKDDISGRFDILSLHICLVFIRLRSLEMKDKDFSQSLFDLFFKDMDQSLRETGVSDVAIPKKIQKLGALFYGLLDKLTKAIDANDKTELTKVLNRNIYDNKNEEKAFLLSQYVLQVEKHLQNQDLNDILKGNLSFSKV